MEQAAWENDKLDRKKDGEHLIELILKRSLNDEGTKAKSYIVNVDAPWGMGKTYFLENVKLSLRDRGYAVAYVNAWQDDHADDPLISVMSAIESELNLHFPKSTASKKAFAKSKKALSVIASESAKQASFHAIKAITGVSVKSIIETLQSEERPDFVFDSDQFDKSAEEVWSKSLEQIAGERISQHQEKNLAIKEFKSETTKAVANLPSQPFFIFVDELDRCRPLYAIKMLEEIKHLFSIDGVVFIVATDSEQLGHSVKAVYGSEFESRKYLRRFFDTVFVFPDANRKEFIRSLFEAEMIDPDATFFPTANIPPLDLFHSWAKAFDLSNRDIQQCMQIVSTFVTSWPHKARIEPVYLLSLIQSFYQKNDPKFTDFDGVPAKEMELDKWQITYPSFDARSGREIPRSHSAAQLMTGLMSDLKTTLATLYDKDSMFRMMFVDEVQKMHNGVMPSSTYSLVREYRSRVQNAGRVVD